MTDIETQDFNPGRLQYRPILRILLIQEANAEGMTDVETQGFNPGRLQPREITISADPTDLIVAGSKCRRHDRCCNAGL